MSPTAGQALEGEVECQRQPCIEKICQYQEKESTENDVLV